MRALQTNGMQRIASLRSKRLLRPSSGAAASSSVTRSGEVVAYGLSRSAPTPVIAR
ncbi:hypothetical protein CZ774_03820 [Frigoribacterium sp. JB110]|nr:hypothetical protein CZ774_03820 [Frigoribacterium sp. JB110]